MGTIGAPEILLIFLIVLGLPLALVGLLVWMLVRRRKAYPATGEDDAISVSELEEIVDQAVRQATAPLHEQLDDLQHRLSRLESATPSRALAGGIDTALSSKQEAPPTERRREP